MKEDEHNAHLHNLTIFNVHMKTITSSPPAHPVPGQLWYDESSGVLKVCDVRMNWTIANESYNDDRYVIANGSRVCGQLSLDSPPTSVNHVATKGYVDTIISHLVIPSAHAPASEPASLNIPDITKNHEGMVLTAGNEPGLCSWQAIPAQKWLRLSIPVYSYQDRSMLRKFSGSIAVVKQLGIFVRVDTGEDDDHTCFASPFGYWLLAGVSADYISPSSGHISLNQPNPNDSLSLAQHKHSATSSVSDLIVATLAKHNHTEVYKEKLNEAIDFISEGSSSSLSNFPLLQVNVEVTEKTGHEVAIDILNQHSHWLQNVVAIERVRLTYEQTINDCHTKECVDQVVHQFKQDLNTIS